MEGIESFEARLRRFTYGKPIEVFAGITNSIGNFYRWELQVAREKKMTNAIFLLTHSLMSVVADKVYFKSGKSGTKFFLKTFVDGDKPDLRFSDVTNDLHDWRNIVAHQIYSKQGHALYLDYDMEEGWRREKGILYFNPGKYADQYLNMFKAGGVFWSHWKQQPEKVKKTRKYRFIVDYLELSEQDAIATEVLKLNPRLDDGAFDLQEKKIQDLIQQRYNL